MRLPALVLATLLIFPLAWGGMHAGTSRNATIARVLDGDTIVLADGRRVRLVQLDAPETDEDECYAAEAKGVLIRLLPFGTEVEIETDPALDERDRFGRILAYVEKDGTPSTWSLSARVRPARTSSTPAGAATHSTSSRRPTKPGSISAASGRPVPAPRSTRSTPSGREVSDL